MNRMSKRNLLDKVIRDNLSKDNLSNIVIDEAFYVVGHRLWFDEKEMMRNE